MLTTLQSRSHYFIDVGNENQKNLSDLICHMANKSEFESSSKSKSFALEFQVIKTLGHHLPSVEVINGLKVKVLRKGYYLCVCEQANTGAGK